MKANPWFRMYSDFMHDEKIEFIAFEDQRHYVFILCMKNAGLLDKEYSQPGMLERIVSKRLGLFGDAFEAARKRLVEAELIDSSFQPLAWNKRQFLSDTSAERTKAYRDRMKRHSDVTVTAQETDTEAETDKEEDKKNTSTRAEAHVVISQKSSTSVLAKPEGVSAEVWADFVSLRKDKRSKLTNTAMAGIQREADKAGWTMDAALSECCARGWTGFKADWVMDKPTATGNRATTAKASPGKHTGFQNLDYKTGINDDGTFS